MSAATIMFIDIVGFSKKPTQEQYRLVNALTGEVIHELRHLLNPPLQPPATTAMPTGDGMALSFLHDTRGSWNRTTLFSLIFRLQKWAFAQTTEHSAVRLRIGLHVGPVEFLTDVNGRLNVCGDTINYAQRVMDAANPSQVLFSETAYREYVGSETVVCSDMRCTPNHKLLFKGPIEILAKHKLRVPVYKVELDPAEQWWKNDDPMAKDLMIVSLTKLPKEIVGIFTEHLKTASRIAFIQLTGDRFLKSYSDQSVQFSGNLKEFLVLMPDPDSYEKLTLPDTRVTVEQISDTIAQWKDFFSDLQRAHPNANLKLGLFKEPPYFGASFIDWDRPKGRIHVSPYVWGLPAQNCPGYDIEWLGSEASPVYKAYVQGLETLNRKTRNVLITE